MLLIMLFFPSLQAHPVCTGFCRRETLLIIAFVTVLATVVIVTLHTHGGSIVKPSVLLYAGNLGTAATAIHYSDCESLVAQTRNSYDVAS